MLQPDNYPRLLGQALTLEPQPFVELVDDDNPWIEGLFFAFLMGLLVAAARLLGGLLLSATLPPPDAVLETIVVTLRQASPVSSGQFFNTELLLRQIWPWFLAGINYGNGWQRLLGLILIPLLYIGQWLLYASIAHCVARTMGGGGKYSETLGALALSLSPRILLGATLIPFVSISPLLLHGWGVLIAYRGLEVAHNLPPGKAGVSALAPLVLGGLLVVLGGVAGSVW
ncbi:MAG TPA: Yip1 family protein, partial [Caldilineaceae bacterium]|nr:Yip1 family protein [Caldilineaceae bacterium]